MVGYFVACSTLTDFPVKLDFVHASPILSLSPPCHRHRMHSLCTHHDTAAIPLHSAFLAERTAGPLSLAINKGELLRSAELSAEGSARQPNRGVYPRAPSTKQQARIFRIDNGTFWRTHFSFSLFLSLSVSLSCAFRADCIADRATDSSIDSVTSSLFDSVQWNVCVCVHELVRRTACSPRVREDSRAPASQRLP